MSSTERKQQVQAISSLGEILRRGGVVTAEHLEEARKLADYKGIKIGQALIALGHITKAQLDWALAIQADLRGDRRKANRAVSELMDMSYLAASAALAKMVG